MNFEKKERPIMVDMERNLLESKKSVYRKELINKLLQFESDIKAMMIHDENDKMIIMTYLKG